MAILIDGFNLIYKFPHLEELMYQGRLEEAMKGLVELLSQYYTIRKESITVVFDGKKKQSDNKRTEKKGGIEIYYSHDLSADYIIKELIKKNPNPRMTSVVTSDNGILFFVKPFKCKMYKSEEFALIVTRAIEESGKPALPEKEENPVVTEEEISYWKKLFRKKT